MKIFKNKFLLILLISAITLVVLVLGAFAVYEKEDLVFSSDGYIIEATSKANKKYYFSANTQYKENVNKKIIFDDVDSNQVEIDPASFVHYSNGDIVFLKKGALVSLTDFNSSIVNYYNITSQNTIKYDKGNYVVSSNDKKINIESFIGRISDNKYLISGKDLKLKIPQNTEKIDGEYFEILFIEDGVIKIDNEKTSYQVTAQDSYIYVGNNITINLGNGKISYEDDVKMLMSQITISGDENINLDVDNKNDSSAGGGGGGGSGSGTGDGDGDGDAEDETGDIGEGEEGEGLGLGEDGESTEGEGTGTGTGEGDGTGEGEEGENGNGGTGTGVEVTDSLRVELIEAVVTSTTIDLSLQLNNADLVKGKLLYYFTNLNTGNREGNSKYIDLVNGTFKVSQESLSPSTDYSFTIVETNNGEEIQYFQKTFTTKDLGISLEKLYATDGSLAYGVNFGENTDVTKTRVSICEEVTDEEGNVNCREFEGNQVIVSKDEIGKEVIFEGLNSNTTYAVSIDMIWLNNAAYSGVYNINRLDTTLKKTPVISGVEVTANTEEVRFDIKLKNVKDKDKSIEKYIYNIYLASDINVDNLDPVIQYSVTKNDADDLVLNLNEIDELKTGVDYRCKIYAQYNDNEMIREVSTEYSSNFLIKSKPKIQFDSTLTTMNSVSGVLKLIDANCTVPFPGRVCSSSNNTFTLRYYKTTEDEHTGNDRVIHFNGSSLDTKLDFEDLESNTTYAVKLFGGYNDDDGNFSEGLQIGDTFFIKTDKSDNIYFEAIDNVSGKNKDGTDNINNVVTIDARLTAPKDSNVMEEISTITFNLYSGRYNVSDKLIGSFSVTDKAEILSLFNNKTITNGLFRDATDMNVGYINTLVKLIKVTNNMTGTLNSSYTIEVEDVYDSTGKNKITVENNVYTFNLTPSYYLDARIASNPNENYITVTPITKKSLTEDESISLSKTVEELDKLNDDTVVGLRIENSLSDIFVDSAYIYEKVVVDYVIYNNTTKNSIKTISVDMGNKYQPKEQVIYLDSSKFDDGKEAFTRGYNYRVGFKMNFITEDGSNPTYTNDKLHKNVIIERQKPIYTQYIYDSNDEGITYKYNFTDVDKTIIDNNFYYKLGKSKDYNSIKNALIVDGEYHDVVVPVSENSDYTLSYAAKDANNETVYETISSYLFEKEYKYDNRVSFSVVDDNTNILKLKLENNDFTSRAYAYRVTIKADGVDTYTRYFLASKLGILQEGIRQLDGTEDGGEEHKYIGIDFANIIDFMNHEMEIEVFCYYDSGLVGINHEFNYGMILKNNDTNKFLNIYYKGKDNTPTSEEDAGAMGIYHMKNAFKHGDTNLFIYNHIIYVPDNASYLGIESEKNLNLNHYGINYGIDYTNEGIVFINGKNKYKGYNVRVLNGVNLVTDNKSYEFETIIPSVKVSTNNTINSIKLNIVSSGIYGDKQFIKDGSTHNKIYVDFYSDKEMTNKLTTKVANINIASNNINIDQVVYTDLDPDTVYYYTVSAYINNKLVRLFDTDILQKKKQYSYVDYNTSTLNVSGILKGFTFSVKPTSYNGDFPINTLSWKLKLENTENYRVRFELYRPDGTNTEINPETGEEVVTKKYKEVNFNGIDSSSCNIDKYGTSTSGYVSGCYINVSKDNIASINNKNNLYTFTNNFDENKNGFVFGDGYYKLVVYAVPYYSNGRYDENRKLTLYEADGLKSTAGTTEKDGIEYNIFVPKLEEASFRLGNSLDVGYSDGYYISFNPTVTDNHFVIKNGVYTATLKDGDGNLAGTCSDGGTVGRCTVNVGANKNITFSNLKSNTLYYIELSYETYRNNVGFSDDDKIKTTPFTDFTYTPIDAGITLGTITARQLTGKSITLTYNGSSNLSKNITKVHYTISLKGGSSKVTGTFEISEKLPNIFTVASDDIPRLTIDVANTDYSDNTGFNFKAGNTYIITTQYYYGDGNILQDQETGNYTYTTILNL